MVGYFEQVPGIDGPLKLLRTGIKIDHQAPSVATPPPMLGEHTDSILGELGYSPEQINTLRKENAL